MQIQDTVPVNDPTYVGEKATVCTFCSKNSAATDAGVSCEPGVMGLLEGKPGSVGLTLLTAGEHLVPPDPEQACRREPGLETGEIPSRRAGVS